MDTREFWVVYDYGMGGAWAIALANSEAEVLNALPGLQVFPEAPEWMTAEVEAKLREVSRFQVASPDTYPEWLQGVLARR